jgi:hypothetical protein
MKIETPYELALRTLFDHVADLEAASVQAGKEALASDDPTETAVQEADFVRFGDEAKVVEQAIKRVMRADIARREPRMPLHKRVLVVDHYFERALSAARIRQGWNERVSAGV